MSTISKENYLKVIYSEGSGKSESVSVTKLAEKLGVTKAAVSDMAKKLAENKFVNYKPYKGIALSKSGEKVALQILRRHRLWELFLMDVLNLSWSEVHQEAENLEHCTSELLVNKIDKYLDYPKFDPHGDPIPDDRGQMPELPELTNLTEVEIGESYNVARVNDESKELIDYLTSVNIRLNSKIIIVDKLNFDNTIFIKINENILPLSDKISNKIFVTHIE